MINKCHTRYCSVCYRSSHLDMFIEKGILKNFAKLTGKHLCRSLFFNKVAGLRPVTLLKKRLAQVFSCGFWKISKYKFFYRTPLVAASIVRRIRKHKKDENTRIRKKKIWKKSKRNKVSCFNIYIVVSAFLQSTAEVGRW